MTKKLEHYGIRGIAGEWFKSYLSERMQFMYVGSIQSDPLHVSCGVPQGSVLGPLLFLLYMSLIKLKVVLVLYQNVVSPEIISILL